MKVLTQFVKRYALILAVLFVGKTASAQTSDPLDPFNDQDHLPESVQAQITIKGAISLDGTDDYIDMSNKLNLNPEGFTISAWIKRSDSNSGTVSILSKRDDAFSEGYDFRCFDNNRLEIIWNNESYHSLTSNTEIPFHQWHHVAVIYNGSEVSLYIDGLRDSTQAATAPTTSNAPFLIGAAGKINPSQHFGGEIDEVRIWNRELTEPQLRFLMNQELEVVSDTVKGSILPNTLTKNELENMPWSALDAYYPMSSFTLEMLMDHSENGIHGILKNAVTIEQQTAPLPFESIQNGEWNARETWKYGDAQYCPGSKSIVNPNATVDWNIVRTAHHITMANQNLPSARNDNRKLLALYIDANTLVLNGEMTTNTGNGLTVTHYLNLKGKLDLEGESQLIQELNCDLKVSPTGAVERDQQGKADTFTYKYWSSPVGVIESDPNNYQYAVKDVIHDGNHLINFLTTSYDGAPTNPIAIADYWIWKYANVPSVNYSTWQHIRRTGTIKAGEGFTMKGPGTGTVTEHQNYVFLGKPNNGNVSLTINADNDYLVGNPYPSAIDANRFILDNVGSNSGSAPTITGTLYFWNHWAGESHYASGYQGGYASYNLSGGVAAPSYGTNNPFVATDGTPSKLPKRYIPVGEGFFVVGKNSGTINFNNAQRVFKKETPSVALVPNSTDSNQNIAETFFDATDADDRMKIRFGFKSVSTIHRQLLLTIDEQTTDGIDWAYDAEINDNQMDDMYWLIEDKAFIIQATANAEPTAKYPIGVKTSTDGINIFTIDALEHVPASVNVFLHDKNLNLYHNLKAGNYEIFLNAGTYDQRFEISFNNSDNALSINDESERQIDILYSNDLETLVLINPKLIDVVTIELYTILGQSVFKLRDLKTQRYAQYDLHNLSTGAYIIKMKSSDGILTKKIMVN